MRIFLALVGFVSYAAALLSLAVAPSAIQEIFAGVLATCGTVAFAGAAIVERLDMLIKRLAPASGPKKVSVDDQPWA
jgi:hypothetical protein